MAENGLKVVIEEEPPTAEQLAAYEARKLRRHHREILVISVTVLLLAVTLVVRPDQRVAFFFLPNYPLPETCFSRAWFNVSCPGCGLTRSVVYLAHGDWESSLALHRLGWLMAVVIALQIPYRLASLRFGGPSRAVQRFNRFLGCSIIVLLFANWLLNMTR